MIVVSDTSALNYLGLIELQDLLPKLCDQVRIPTAVQRELQTHDTPEPVRQFVAAPPGWLEVLPSPEIPVNLEHLDAGERGAISPALALNADVVLRDERKARHVAREQGLQVAGTLAVIGLTAERTLVQLEHALDRLQKTNFRVSPRLLKSLRDGSTHD